MMTRRKMTRRKMTEEEKIARKEKMKWNEELKRETDILNYQFKEVLKYNTNLPTKTRCFEKGERVRYGNHLYTHILDYTNDRRCYKVLIDESEIKYGKIIGRYFKITWLSWLDVIKYHSFKNFDNSDRLVNGNDRFYILNFSNREISSLFNLRYHFGIDLNPDYQRGNVWNEKQEYNLIDSIFNCIDIGKFTIIKNKFDLKNKYHYEMLDGKQRLTAILKFYEDRLKFKG